MSTRWAFDRYTFGAARIALRPEPYVGADRELTLWQGLALASQDWSRAGGSLRRRTATAGALLVGAWLLALLVSKALRERDPGQDLQIVRFESPAIEEPLPIPAPEPVVEAAPVLAPEPVAARPPPPSARPAPIARPAPERAPIAKPAPTPARVARPALPPPPATIAPPRIAAAPSRPPAPRPSFPKSVVSIDAVPAPTSARATSSEPPRRALRPATAPASKPRPAPSFDLGAPAAPGLLPEAAPPANDPRRAVAAPSARAGSGARSVARPALGLALPALAAGGPVRDPGSEPTPARTAARVAAPAGGASQARSNEPRLSGVPLGSLASCVSDRDEDALKQQLVAIVGKPSECVSEAGRYRFVETRNLNSFLLWVERAPSRREADRCVELGHALECIRKRAGGEWSRG
jgi:hypothetical protein